MKASWGTVICKMILECLSLPIAYSVKTLGPQELPWWSSVKTSHFHCRGHRINPWMGNWDLHATQHIIWPWIPQHCLLFFFFKWFYLFLNFWLCWIFVAACSLSLVVASRGYSLVVLLGFSLQRVLLSQSTGSRRSGSAVVAHRFSCPKACGILVPKLGIEPMFPVL